MCSMPSSQGRKTCNVNDLLDVSQRDGTQLLWTILGMISFPHSKFYSLDITNYFGLLAFF